MKALLSILLFCPVAALCCVPFHPPMTTENYDRIFFGEVLSVDLLPYETITFPNGEIDEIIPTDYTRNHSVTIKTGQIVKGMVDSEITVIAGGCGVVIPEAGQTGIFFNSSIQQTTVTVYDSQTVLYSDWINILDQ